MNRWRLWLTIKWETSGWAQIAILLVMVLVNVVFGLWFVGLAPPSWVGVLVFIIWVFGLASFVTWLVSARREG